MKYTDVRLEKAKETAEQSAILLKNADNVLPLSEKVRTIAVVGPMADAPPTTNSEHGVLMVRKTDTDSFEYLRKLYGDKSE